MGANSSKNRIVILTVLFLMISAGYYWFSHNTSFPQFTKIWILNSHPESRVSLFLRDTQLNEITLNGNSITDRYDSRCSCVQITGSGVINWSQNQITIDAIGVQVNRQLLPLDRGKSYVIARNGGVTPGYIRTAD